MPPESLGSLFLKTWKQGWIAGYPPWFFNFWIKHANCKTDEESSHLLHFLRALEDGKLDEARRLLPGIDPNLRLTIEGNHTQSLLAWATEKCRNPDCIRLLVEAGANLKARGIVANLAMRYGENDLLAEMLKAGADPNLSHRDSDPLTIACCRDAKTVRILLEAGARHDATTTVYITNKKKVDKVTPLMVAAYAGQPQIVKILLAAGADPKALDSTQGTAITWAKISRSRAKAAKIIPLLEEAGATEGAGKEGLEPVDFSARSKTPEFKQALDLCKKLTKSAARAVQLSEGPLAGAKVFGIRKGQSAMAVLEEIRLQVASLGAFAFLSEQMEPGSDGLVLVPTTDYRQAIIAFETPVGQSMDCYELIAWLNNLEKTQPFIVTHIAPDLFRAKFTTPLKDSASLAKAIEKICSDVINEALPEVAHHLEQSRELYLWWD